MRRSDNRTVLTDEVARFQAEVQRLAFAVVRAVLRQELDRKRQELDRKRAKLQSPRRRAQKPAPVAAPVVAAPVRPQEPPPPAPPPATAPAGGRKRVPWTRDAIINELATWMVSGTSIDATFVTRHGPPGLVAATRRIFGRFEAALNVAALHVSKLYPDGPPARGQP